MSRRTKSRMAIWLLPFCLTVACIVGWLVAKNDGLFVGIGTVAAVWFIGGLFIYCRHAWMCIDYFLIRPNRNPK